MSEDDLPNQASESDNSTVDTLRDSRYSNPSNSSMIEAPIRSPAFVSDTEDDEDDDFDDDFDSFSLSSSDDDNESDEKKEEEEEEEERAEEDLEELPTVGMKEQHESSVSFETDRTRFSRAIEEVPQGAIEAEISSGCPHQVYQSASLALPEEARNDDSRNPSNQSLPLNEPQGSAIHSLGVPTRPFEAVLHQEETQSQLSPSQDYAPIVPATTIPDLDAALSAWVAGEDSTSIITHVSSVVAELIAYIHEDPPEAQARRIVEVLYPLRHLPQPQQPTEGASVPVFVTGQQEDEDSSLTDLSNMVEDAVRLSTDPRIQIHHIVDAFLLNFFDRRQLVGMDNTSSVHHSSVHDDSLAGLIRRSSRVQREGHLGEENRRPDPPGVAEMDLRRSRTSVDLPEERDEDDMLDADSTSPGTDTAREEPMMERTDLHEGASALESLAVEIAVDSPRPPEPTSQASVYKEPTHPTNRRTVSAPHGAYRVGGSRSMPLPPIDLRPIRDDETVPRSAGFDPAVAELSYQIRELSLSMAEMRQRLDEIVGPPPNQIRPSAVEVRPEQQDSSPSLSVPPPVPPPQQVSSSLFSVSHSLPPAATEIVPTMVSIPDAVVVRSDDDDESTYLGEIQRATRERQTSSASSRRPRRRGLRRLFPWRWSSAKRPK